MEKKTRSDRPLTRMVTCAECGKKLPVEIMEVDGSATIGIFCKHCKTITILRVS